MRKLKTIIPVAGILLLILSAASLYVAMQVLSDVRPAEDYEDIGVLTFQPYDVLPVQVQNTGASSRDRRMNPTKTVYMVYYRATDGSGYKWSDEALTRDLGEDIVEAGETVERRVLSIPSDGTYITVEPEQTAGSYTEGLRGKYTRIIGLSTLYILFYLIALILVKLVSRLRKNWAANQEVERAAVPRNVSAASQLGPEIEEPRRSRPPEKWSGWRQEPGGLEVRKPPRIHPRIKLCLFLLAAVLLLAVFQRLGSSDPVDLDYGWNGNTWICDELGLRFDLPAGGVIYDSEEQQKAREETFGRRGSAGQVLLTVIDPGECSNLELLVVRTDPPTEDFLLKMAALYAENAAGEGTFELEAREDLTVGGRPWRTWRIELPEQGRVNWYLYRQDGEYALSLTSSGPTAQTPPAILACFQGTDSLGIVPTNQYLPPIGADGYFTATFPPSLLGNMTPDELVEDFQRDAEAAAEQGLTPDQLPSFRDLTANGDGSVTYSFTEEQYRRSKETYYAWGLRILPEFFGLDPAEVVKGLEYDRVDANGIPWGVTVRVDRTAFQDQGTFAEFVSQLVPYTMIGRYQIMCGIPAGEWAVHVTVKDAGSGEIILEQDFCG